MRIKNKLIYDEAIIPRFDTACIMLTRNYYSTCYQINNNLINKLKIENQAQVLRMVRSNYSPPKLFKNLDKLGCIQDSHNLPVIYHIKRHCAKKAICIDTENVPPEKWVYSRDLPKRDSESLDRLSEKYWWL